MSVIELTEKRLSEVVRFEEPVAMYSRDTATAGADIKVGDLIKVAANGTATVIAAAETPNGVAIYPASNGNAFTYLARHAVVNGTGINYPDGATDAQKKAMVLGLKTAGILVRT